MNKVIIDESTQTYIDDKNNIYTINYDGNPILIGKKEDKDVYLLVKEYKNRYDNLLHDLNLINKRISFNSSTLPKGIIESLLKRKAIINKGAYIGDRKALYKLYDKVEHDIKTRIEYREYRSVKDVENRVDYLLNKANCFNVNKFKLYFANLLECCKLLPFDYKDAKYVNDYVSKQQSIFLQRSKELYKELHKQQSHEYNQRYELIHKLEAIDISEINEASCNEINKSVYQIKNSWRAIKGGNNSKTQYLQSKFNRLYNNILDKSMAAYRVILEKDKVKKEAKEKVFNKISAFTHLTDEEIASLKEEWNSIGHLAHHEIDRKYEYRFIELINNVNNSRIKGNENIKGSFYNGNNMGKKRLRTYDILCKLQEHELKLKIKRDKLQSSNSSKEDIKYLDTAIIDHNKLINDMS